MPKLVNPKIAARKVTLAEARQHEPEALITFRVSVLAQLLSRVVDHSVGRELGLSSRQWRILVMLQRHGPSTSGDVARHACLDHSQISRASFELSQLGLVEQQIDTVDRRRQMLAITRNGLEVLRCGLPGSMEREARLRACLSEDDYAVLLRALAALTDEARAMLPAAMGTAAD